MRLDQADDLENDLTQLMAKYALKSLAFFSFYEANNGPQCVSLRLSRPARDPTHDVVFRLLSDTAFQGALREISRLPSAHVLFSTGDIGNGRHQNPDN